MGGGRARARVQRGDDGRWSWAVFDRDERLVAVSPPAGYRQADEAELEIRRLVSGIFAGLAIVRDGPGTA